MEYLKYDREFLGIPGNSFWELFRGIPGNFRPQECIDITTLATPWRVIVCCTRLRANLTQMSREIRDRVSRSSGEFPTHLSTETRPWARPRTHTPRASTDRKGSRHITPNHRGEAICRDMILGNSRGARFLLDLFCPKFNSRGFASWRPGACPGVRPGSTQHKYQRWFTPL